MNDSGYGEAASFPPFDLTQRRRDAKIHESSPCVSALSLRLCVKISEAIYGYVEGHGGGDHPEEIQRNAAGNEHHDAEAQERTQPAY